MSKPCAFDSSPMPLVDTSMYCVTPMVHFQKECGSVVYATEYKLLKFSLRHALTHQSFVRSGFFSASETHMFPEPVVVYFDYHITRKRTMKSIQIEDPAQVKVPHLVLDEGKNIRATIPRVGQTYELELATAAFWFADSSTLPPKKLSGEIVEVYPSAETSGVLGITVPYFQVATSNLFAEICPARFTRGHTRIFVEEKKRPRVQIENEFGLLEYIPDTSC